MKRKTIVKIQLRETQKKYEETTTENITGSKSERAEAGDVTEPQPERLKEARRLYRHTTGAEVIVPCETH